MTVALLEPLEIRRLFAGITLITHGQGGDAGGEVAATADRIAARAGGAAQYVMTVESDGLGGATVASFVLDPGSSTRESIPNGEVIIKLDYNDVNTLPTWVPAAAVAEHLLVNGLLEQQVHLAGPSRGGSLVSNLAIALGKRGVWVDHLTFIDPVPADSVVPIPGIPIDGPLRVTDNVVFADNYWRSDDNVLTGFDGRHVDGAHEGNLNSTVQADHFGDPHVGAGAYYIATINPSEPIVPPAKSSWFRGTPDAPARNQTGYVFSRIVNVARPNDGVHPAFGGTAHRDAVRRVGSQWSNVAPPAVVGKPASVVAGSEITVKLAYGDADGATTLSLYLDRDRNPYNGNTVSRFARQSVPAAEHAGIRLTGSTHEATAGTYWIYAQVRDAQGHLRYAYSATPLVVTAPDASMLFATTQGGDLRISGTPGGDRVVVTTDGLKLYATRNGFTQPVAASGIDRLVLDVGRGDDSVLVSDHITLPSLLLGADGNDTLMGSDADDTLWGGTGHDRLFGAGGNDRIEGAGQNDYIEGGAGADSLFGDNGGDVLLGLAGNDRLFGGIGADTVMGGPGVDATEDDPNDVVNSVP